MEANSIPWNSFAVSTRLSRQTHEQKISETILVVEDNPVVYALFQHCHLYYPFSFCGRHSAILHVHQELPKLIVLHVEHDDAMELIVKFKTHHHTNDIPVMVVSKSWNESQRREAFEAGVDECWPAPLQVDDFLIRARNLIQTRKMLREKFSHAVAPAEMVSSDEKFVEKVMQAIQRLMDDPDFSVKILARETGTSVTQLYRKCLALTHRPPNDLIRHWRLTRAAEMLRWHCGNVSEVAYQVGFTNLSYFTKCFKTQFNCLPSEYIKSTGV